jgi:hypothetical protein
MQDYEYDSCDFRSATEMSSTYPSTTLLSIFFHVSWFLNWNATFFTFVLRRL